MNRQTQIHLLVIWLVIFVILGFRVADFYDSNDELNKVYSILRKLKDGQSKIVEHMEYSGYDH